jgi:2-polyprenyl-6-methoxyphenol hydroxylase-like FAD-dependent oxidoreductase
MFGITEAYELSRAMREAAEKYRLGCEDVAEAIRDLAAAQRGEPRPETRAEKSDRWKREHPEKVAAMNVVAAMFGGGMVA